MALMVEDKQASGLAAGVELTKTSAQVSYMHPGDREPETLSAVAGSELYDFPLILGRRKNNGQWIFGREAAEAASRGEAECVDDLYRLAVADARVTIGGERYQGVSLLALYVKKLLQTMVMESAGAGVSLDVIRALEWTVDDPEEEETAMLRSLTEEIRGSLPQVKRIDWCTHAESIYRYLAGQPEEYRAQEVMAFYLKSGKLTSFRHEINHRTRPYVAGVERFEEREIPQELPNAEKDERLLFAARERMTGHLVSAVYLLGDGFDESWLKRSLDYICRNRRCFLGNNLFSKGAAFCAAGALLPEPEGEEIIFLGSDKILANIGIRVKKQGESHYHALLDAGTSWHHARAGIDLILDRDEMIALEITPLSGEGKRIEVLELTGLPKRERRTTRISLEITMFSVDRLRLSAVDLGFGDFYPPSGEHWERFIGLRETGTGLASGMISEPILCTGRLATQPLMFHFLETRVFSVEELCYFISKNDYLLTMESFPDTLPAWLKEACALTPLAEELQDLRRRQCSLVAYVATILEYVRLYPSEEIGRIEENLRDGDARNGVEKKLKIIEYLIREHRLYEAHAMVHSFQTEGAHPVVQARVLYDEGVIYARMFQYGAAAACMRKAYEISGDAQVKEAYLAALRLSMDEETYIDTIGGRPELSPESLTLESKLGEMLDLFAAGPDNHLVNTLQVYLDTGNLRQFDEDTAEVEEETVALFKRALG